MPNGGQRLAKSGKILQDMGMISGFPDVFLLEARGGYFALFIELKRNKKYSPSQMKTQTWLNQEAWLIRLRKKGYYAQRCFGYEEAISVVLKYMGWKLTQFKDDAL